MEGLNIEFLPLRTIEDESADQYTFPIDAFPKPVQEIAQAFNRTLNFPIEYFLTSVLSATATAIGNTCIIEAKRGFTMKAILYAAICGNPGVNKSAPISYALNPFFLIERRRMREYKAEMEEWEAIEKNKDKKPILKKTIISNATMEGINRVHAENSRGLCVYVDELGGFLKSFNMYRKGNDEEQWLSNFDGRDIIIDRKNAESQIITQPNINIIGSIQPGVFQKLFNDKVENGLLDRFIIAETEDTPKVLFTDEEPSEEIFTLYEKYILRILEIPLETDENGEVKPHVYRFSSEAKEEFRQWFDKQTPTGKSIADGINAKMKTYCLRFSLIIEIMKGSLAEKFITEISIDTVKSAIQLCEYYKKTAIRLRSKMNLIDVEDTLNEDQKRVFALLPLDFKFSEIEEISKWSKPKIYRFLKNEQLFNKKTSHGQYKKITND